MEQIADGHVPFRQYLRVRLLTSLDFIFLCFFSLIFTNMWRVANGEALNVISLALCKYILFLRDCSTSVSNFLLSWLWFMGQFGTIFSCHVDKLIQCRRHAS